MHESGNGRDTSPVPGANPLAELFQVNPGDAMDFWMEGPRVAKTTFICREEFEGHAYEWRWIFLDDGSLVEASPDGFFRYREHHVIKQGAPLYQEIVAQDGALVRFEEYVRQGTSDERPVEFSHEGRRFRIASTGTVLCRRLGDEPEPLPWKYFSSNLKDNVYFGLAIVGDEEAVGLGLWTAHVCISVGKVLESADVTAIYRR